MRVLLTTPPSIDRLHNLVPLGWALRTGGHEVQIAGPSGFTPAINRTGFVAVDTGDAQSPEGVLADAEAVDELVDYAALWRPDIVVWDQSAPAGSIAACTARALSVRMLSVLDDGLLDAAELRRQLGASVARHDVAADAAIDGQLTIDTTPPSMAFRPDGGRRRIRHVPYSGAAVIPAWLRRMPRSARVCVLPSASADSLGRLLEAVRGVDAEMVCVAAREQVPAGIALPDNVRLVDAAPLDVLLPTCRAVVHDGSPTAAAAAAAYGLPRLDASAAGSLAESVKLLIDDPESLERARREQAEIEALPSPREIAAQLVALAVETSAVETSAVGNRAVGV